MHVWDGDTMTDPADTKMSHQRPVGPVDHPEATPPGQPAAPTLGSPAAGFDAKGRVRRTRISGVWVGGADHRCSVSDLAGGVHRAEHRQGVKSTSSASTGTCRLA